MNQARPAVARTTNVPVQRGPAGAEAAPPRHPTATERAARGLAARKVLPPGEHSELVRPVARSSPVAVLLAQATTRVPDLVPVRHARMVASPFSFFRGAAALMARDLAAAPTTDLTVQLCGDAHLSNFGVFGTPERRLIFDINDFDETLPGPWEWDVKRLAASIAVAGRENGLDDRARRRAVRAAVDRYQQAMARLATMRELDVWYYRVDVDELVEILRKQFSKQRGKQLDRNVAKARRNDSLRAFGKLTEVVDGRRRIKADPPLLVPIGDLLPGVARHRLESEIKGLLTSYSESLLPDRRLLLSKFRFVDMARKVVGVGSVGTRCWIVLLEGRDANDPLFLQVKEAQESVLAPHVPRSEQQGRPTNQGERVVAGQRVMQAASDTFLGWDRATGIDGAQRDFYFRQLRDQKGSAVVETMGPKTLRVYGELCGGTLARAHARSGDAIAIAAYLGDDTAFSKAVADFAEKYADLNERDHAEVVEAVRAGRLPADPAR